MTEQEMERAFLLDYVWFGRMLGAYQADAIYRAYTTATLSDVRRIHFVNLHAVLMTVHETLAAFLLGMRRRVEKRIGLMETLLRYRPGEADLEEILKDVLDRAAFEACFGIDTVAMVQRGFPERELDKRIADLFKSVKVSAIEQEKRIRAFNKTKHGQVVLSSCAVVAPSLGDIGPAALDLLKDPNDSVVPRSLTFAPDEAERFAGIAVRMGAAVGDLTLFYLLSNHDTAFANLSAVVNAKADVLAMEETWRTNEASPPSGTGSPRGIP